MKKFSQLFQKTKTWAKAHKFLAAIGLVVFVGGGYGVVRAFTSDAAETRYILAQVRRGDVVVSVSGTGQVSASDQIDITAKTSGDLIYLNAKAGQSVAAGTLLGQIDAGDAAYELETAKLSYEELMTVDESELRDAENAVTNATDDLADSYTTARANLTAASTDMADVLADLKDLFGGYLSTISGSFVSNTSKDYILRAKDSYYAADKSLNGLIKKYRTLSASTPKSQIESMINESYEVAVLVAQAGKYAQDATVYKRDREDRVSVQADDAYTTVTGLVSTANSVVSTLSTARSSIVNGKRTLEAAQNDLADLKAGPDDLDVRSEQLSLRQKQEALADYYIRAPFAGIIASVDVKKGDRMSNGGAIATLITKDKIAEISLNEIDAAKVAVGQKATLTFDAIEGLTITGKVLEVDLIGSVSQGVVNYTVKIGFDADDNRIKPGMTTSAEIVTETKENVLIVSASAVKNQGRTNYVEVTNEKFGGQLNGQANGQTNSAEFARGAQVGGVLLSTRPSRTEVVIGLSNDDVTEIVSGLEEGEQYIARTVTTGATTQTAQAAPSLFGGARTNRPAGGFGRGAGG